MDFARNSLQTGGVSYKTVVLPECRFIPLKTFEKLVELARKGPTIIVNNSLPSDVPGWGNLDECRNDLQKLFAQLNFAKVKNSDIQRAMIGNGNFLLGNDLIDYVRYWSERTGLAARRLIHWLGIGRSRYYQWRERYGKVNEHNAWIPRDSWLEKWEEEAIVASYREHPREGYRRLTYMLMDADMENKNSFAQVPSLTRTSNWFPPRRGEEQGCPWATLKQLSYTRFGSEVNK